VACVQLQENISLNVSPLSGHCHVHWLVEKQPLSIL
jgi:hypothetical protein